MMSSASTSDLDRLGLSERLTGDITILEVTGRLTLGEAAHRFRETIRDILRRGSRKIALDFSRLKYMDSTGTGELVTANTAITNEGGRFKIFGASKKLHDLLHIAKLQTVFEVLDSEEEVLKLFGVFPLYCLCPVCKRPSRPALLDERGWWGPQACHNCGARFELEPRRYAQEEPVVRSLRLETFENEYVQVLAGAPFTIEVVGRLEAFSSTALDKAWRVLPQPRRVLFDLRASTEISNAGGDALLALLANREKEASATVSVEGLSDKQRQALPISPPVYFDRAGALAALGDVSDTPAWRVEVSRIS
jgi:anti-sigma B factor antagonist